MQGLRQGFLTFYVLLDNFGRSWSACGQHENQYAELRMNKRNYM
jgi:hypothetical protein